MGHPDCSHRISSSLHYTNQSLEHWYMQIGWWCCTEMACFLLSLTFSISLLASSLPNWFFFVSLFCKNCTTQYFAIPKWKCEISPWLISIIIDPPFCSIGTPLSLKNSYKAFWLTLFNSVVNPSGRSHMDKFLQPLKPFFFCSFSVTKSGRPTKLQLIADNRKIATDNRWWTGGFYCPRWYLFFAISAWRQSQSLTMSCLSFYPSP